MDYCSILDIDSIAYAYGIDISADHCAPPYRAIIAQDDIPDDSGIVSKEAILAK